MASILRAKLRWTGLPGGTGYSIFHFGEFSFGEPDVNTANAAKDRLGQFIGQIKPFIPPSVTMQVETELEVIESTNGLMTNVLGGTAGPGAAGLGSGTLGYSAPTGAVMSWSTGGIRNGRRIRGRTFIVPLAGNAYQNNGTLEEGCLTNLNAAAAALSSITGQPDLGVYARPTSKGATDGVWYAVTGFRIPDMAAILSSRRS